MHAHGGHDAAGSFLDHLDPGLAEARAEGASTSEVDPAAHPEPVAPPAEATLVFALQTAPAEAATRPIAEGSGTRIGPYKLLQQIGEGGMGVVYMAEQEAPVRRKVALKIIKPGMDTGQVVARFEAERQALALMDHPHIAKALDAGPAEKKARIQPTLRHWKVDADIDGIREAKELADLPDEERTALELLWNDVDRLATRAAGAP